MNDDSLPEARYLIQAPIGEGGAGQVFRAWDQRLQRAVAVKRLHADVEMDADLRREAGILAALHHPNIVTIYDFAADEAGPFVVMEYVEGHTLEEVVAHQPLSLPAFVELADQVCRGLSAAHSRGLVHLDLKAGNLMLQFHEDRSFTCKILDFGIAHLQHEARAEADDGTVLGSPYTVAPEQLLREPVDARTDLYALGCVFYQALSGREPFEADEVGGILQRHLHGQTLPLDQVAAQVPGPLSHVVARMLARRPADRPGSAEEVRRMLQSAMRAPSATNRPRPAAPLRQPATTRAAAPPSGGGGGKMFPVLLLAAAATAGGFFYFRAAPPPGPSAAPPAAAPAAPAYPAVDPLDARAVAEHRGQTVTMAGVVAAQEESPLFGARLLRFAGGQDATVVVSVQDGLLGDERARSLVGKRVRATGQISTAANRTRLVVASADDLTVVP